MEFLVEKLNETDEIWNYLQKKKSFMGCFPSDKIPPICSFPATMIINTADSSNAGEHWVGLYMEEKFCLYFDSFGLPVLEENIRKYLSRYYNNYVYNKICIQDIASKACGLFCIAFVKSVYSVKTYYNFIHQFEPNKHNDYNLLHFI